jgi:hypothetical protein
MAFLHSQHILAEHMLHTTLLQPPLFVMAAPHTGHAFVVART